MDQPVLATPTEPVATPTPSRLIDMSLLKLLRVAFIGFVAGLISAGGAIALNQFVFSAVLCRPGMGGCDQAPVYAVIVSIIVSSIVGVILLAQMRIYRPLLIVIATGFALWSTLGWFLTMPWYLSLITGGVLFAISYSLFSWILRFRSLILAGILLVALTVLLRLVTS